MFCTIHSRHFWSISKIFNIHKDNRVYLSLSLCVCVCVCVCVCAFVFVWIRVWFRMSVCVCVCVWMCVCVCTYARECVCVCVCVFLCLKRNSSSQRCCYVNYYRRTFNKTRKAIKKILFASADRYHVPHYLNLSPSNGPLWTTMSNRLDRFIKDAKRCLHYDLFVGMLVLRPTIIFLQSI